jgi:hypothetical protein
MLLVSRYGLVEDDAAEVFHYYGFHLFSCFLMYNFKSFGENNVENYYVIYIHERDKGELTKK